MRDRSADDQRNKNSATQTKTSFGSEALLENTSDLPRTYMDLDEQTIQALKESEARIKLHGVRAFTEEEIHTFFDTL